MKKVLHIGFNSPIHYSGGWEKAFKENGFDEYVFLDWQKMLLNAGLDGAWARILFNAEQEKPDLIFMQINVDGFIFPYEAKEISKYGYTVLRIEDVREDISWVEDVAPFLKLILFSNVEDVASMKLKGFNNVDYLQASADFDFYKPVLPSKRYGEIIFIGNQYSNTDSCFPLSKQRDEMIKFLQNEYGNKRFKVYGRGYGQVLNPEQEREAYSDCSVAITQNQFQRERYTSDRLFRAIGCGAYPLSQYYEGINNDFFLTKIAYWGTFSQLRTICNGALKLAKERQQLAFKIRKFSMLHHSHTYRIKTLKLLIDKHVSIFKAHSKQQHSLQGQAQVERGSSSN